MFFIPPLESFVQRIDDTFSNFPPRIEVTQTKPSDVSFSFDGKEYRLKFKEDSRQDSETEITEKDLTPENLTSTVDKLLKKYGEKFPHLEQARNAGFKYSVYDASSPRFSESLKTTMQSARAATNCTSREVLFNVPNLISTASGRGISLEKQVILTLSNEACHILWGKSLSTRSVDQARTDIEEVWKKHQASDTSLTSLEKDVTDRAYDEFISSVAMRFTEICLDSKTKPSLEKLLKEEITFLNTTLSAHVDSGFYAVLPKPILDEMKIAKMNSSPTEEQQKLIALIDRINKYLSSAAFGERVLKGIKDLNLPISGIMHIGIS